MKIGEQQYFALQRIRSLLDTLSVRRVLMKHFDILNNVEQELKCLRQEIFHEEELARALKKARKK